MVTHREEWRIWYEIPFPERWERREEADPRMTAMTISARTPTRNRATPATAERVPKTAAVGVVPVPGKVPLTARKSLTDTVEEQSLQMIDLTLREASDLKETWILMTMTLREIKERGKIPVVAAALIADLVRGMDPRATSLTIQTH